MAETQKVSAVLTARAAKSISLPPCELGWADLITPKAFEKDAPKLGEGAPKFMIDCHYSPLGLEALALKLLAVIAAQLPALKKAAALNGPVDPKTGEIKGTILKDPISAEDWLEAQLKTPKTAAKIQLPFIKLRAPGYRKGKRDPDGSFGDPILNLMGCWDPDNQPLDLSKLRLSAGSVIQPIVYPNLFASKPAMWIPQPSLKLVGVRVLKVVSFGGRGGPQAPDDADDEAIKKVLGADFDIHQDLSQYAVGADDVPDVPDHGDDDLGGTF